MLVILQLTVPFSLINLLSEASFSTNERLIIICENHVIGTIARGAEEVETLLKCCC